MEEKLKWFDAGSSQLGDSSEPDSSTETSGMSSANREDVRRRRKAGKKQGSRMWDLANETLKARPKLLRKREWRCKWDTA